MQSNQVVSAVKLAQGGQISPLFHEDAQDAQCNLFEHLASRWVAGFLAAEIPPTRYGLANVPHFIRRPCPLAWGGLGMVSGGVVFPGLSKLLQSEDALGVPCLDTVMVALAAGPRGAGKGVIRRFDFTLRFATPDIRLASADAFAVVGGGCTGRAHGCKAKQGRGGKDGADG